MYGVGLERVYGACVIVGVGMDASTETDEAGTSISQRERNKTSADKLHSSMRGLQIRVEKW
jgi:hypothetical protein